MLAGTTGEIEKMTLKHEENIVREFYSNLPRPVRLGIEATGSMQWFVNLMEELGIECLVGHPAEIRAAEPRKQKHDRRDAFPTIWLPTKELLDIRALLRHRHQWVDLRVKIQNALQAIALANGLRQALPHGPKQANTRSRLCCHPMPPIGGMSCRRCM
jgi:transposase